MITDGRQSIRDPSNDHQRRRAANTFDLLRLKRVTLGPGGVGDTRVTPSRPPFVPFSVFPLSSLSNVVALPSVLIHSGLLNLDASPSRAILLLLMTVEDYVTDLNLTLDARRLRSMHHHGGKLDLAGAQSDWSSDFALGAWCSHWRVFNWNDALPVEAVAILPDMALHQAPRESLLHWTARRSRCYIAVLRNSVERSWRLYGSRPAI